MRSILRVAAIAMIFLGAYVLAWLPSMLLLGDYAWLGSLVALGVAIVAARRAWSLGGEGPRTVRSAVLLGALLLGGTGFAVGFFGPLLLAPEANQGPLLGILITGPAGYFLGGVLGLWFALRDRTQRT